MASNIKAHPGWSYYHDKVLLPISKPKKIVLPIVQFWSERQESSYFANTLANPAQVLTPVHIK